MPVDTRLFILDSSAASRKRLAHTLGRLGYTVTLGTSLSQLASQIVTYPVVILVTHGRAQESIGQIADLRARLPQTGVIVIGMRSLEAALAAWHAGADDYLPRPVHDHDLLGALTHNEQIRAISLSRVAQEQELRALLTRLGGALNQTSGTTDPRQLVAALAHQISNPLTPLLGMAELLVEDLPLDHPGREYAQLIIASAVRIRDVVWRLADIAQLSD
jgi:ActR/RegA family two-component response regulator